MRRAGRACLRSTAPELPRDNRAGAQLPAAASSRISATLRREFDLDSEALTELSDELVQIQQVTIVDGDVLAWKDAEPVIAPSPAIAPSQRDPRLLHAEA
jgi:hypothetical protein